MLNCIAVPNLVFACALSCLKFSTSIYVGPAFFQTNTIPWSARVLSSYCFTPTAIVVPSPDIVTVSPNLAPTCESVLGVSVCQSSYCAKPVESDAPFLNT